MSGGVRRVKRVRAAAFAALTVVVLSACDATGGGWLWGVNETAKANIGVNGSCTPIDEYTPFGTLSGELSFVDRSTSDPRVSFVLREGICTIDPYTGDFLIEGSYIARPKGDGGTAEIRLHDTGDNGPSKGDELVVELCGGAFDGYYLEGTLQGGNLKITYDT